jgi:hypothetical protein
LSGEDIPERFNRVIALEDDLGVENASAVLQQLGL